MSVRITIVVVETEPGNVNIVMRVEEGVCSHNEAVQVEAIYKAVSASLPHDQGKQFGELHIKDLKPS